MALIVPLIAVPHFENSCIGNFFHTNCKHLATPNRHCIDFQIVDSDKTSVHHSLSKRIIAQGRILSSFKVSTDLNGLDVLAVHIRGVSQYSEAVIDQIQFLRFNESENDLVLVGNFECEIPQVSLADLPAPEISVCCSSGSNHGITIYSNGHMGRVYIIDPLSFRNVSSHIFSELLTPFCPVKTFWLSDSEIAFAREAKYMTHLAFARILKHGGGSKPSSFRLKVFTSPVSLKPHTERVSSIASLENAPQKNFVVIYPKSVSFLKLNKSAVKEGKSIVLPFSECRGRQWWAIKCSEGGVVCVSSDRRSFHISEELTLENVDFESARSSRIRQLCSDDYYLCEKDGSSRLGIVRLKFDQTRKKIAEYLMKPHSNQFTDFQLSSHLFDTTFGSEYWANFRYSHHPGTLVRSRKSSEISRFVFHDLLQDTVFSIMALGAEGDHFLVSTQRKSLLFQLKSNAPQISLTEVSAPSWMDLASPSIYAKSGVQITPDEIRKVDSEPYKFGIPGINSAFVNDLLTIMTTISDIFIITGAFEKFKLSFKNAIITFDATEQALAVLTSHCLTLYDLDQLSDQMLPRLTQNFTAAATCLLAVSAGGYVVGFSDGRALILPEGRYLQLSSGSISNLYWHRSLNVLVVCSSDGINLYEFKTQLVIEGPKGNFSSFAHFAASNFGLVANNGALEAIELQLGFKFVQEVISDPAGQSNANFGMYNAFSMIALDSEHRKVTTCDRRDFSNKISGILPNVLADSPAQVSQLFLLDDCRLMEVAHSPCNMNDSEINFDDFRVLIRITLFQFAIDDESLSFRCLSFVETVLSGDPYDEVAVKFITPTRFTVFTHSVECLPCEIAGTDIQIGSPSPAHTYVYDDHWIFDKARGLVHAIDFTGTISSELVNKFDIGRAVYPSTEESTIFNNDPNSMIFDALMTNSQSEVDPNPRFAVTKKRPTNEPVSELQIFDYDCQKRQAITLASLYFPSREVKLLQVNSEMKSWLSKKFETLNMKYSFTPEVVVSTSNGSTYIVACPKDAELRVSLKRIQKRLINDLGTLVSQNYMRTNSKDVTVFDGAMLKEALEVPRLRSLFAEHNVDPDQLQLSLNLLSF